MDISIAWTTFILDKSDGFTKAGIVRINESIRTFVWALLGSQSQTRVNILEMGKGFDAQKQFMSDVQDVINSPIDVPTQIVNYENVLKYARSKVNYVYGLGLYMSPDDMVLRIGEIVGYNNKIVVATENQTLGLNLDPDTEDKKVSEAEDKGFPKESNMIPKVSEAIPRFPRFTKFPKESNVTPKETKLIPKVSEVIPKKNKEISEKASEAIIKENKNEHEDNKKAIIFTFILIGFFISDNGAI